MDLGIFGEPIPKSLVDVRLVLLPRLLPPLLDLLLDVFPCCGLHNDWENELLSSIDMFLTRRRIFSSPTEDSDSLRAFLVLGNASRGAAQERLRNGMMLFVVGFVYQVSNIVSGFLRRFGKNNDKMYRRIRIMLYAR